MTELTQLEQNKYQWLERIKEGESKALEVLYRAYRKEFIRWLCQKTACDEELALDIFQESVLVLYKNAKTGRLGEMKGSIKTYLFAVGRKLFLLQNRNNRIKTANLEVDKGLLEQLKIVPQHAKNLTDRQQMVTELIPRLRMLCQDLLYMFYYEGLNIKEITQRQNYKTTNVTKVMKSRCMESLRKMVYQHLKKNK
ncbi:MAG: RNA polymerase sigma factor [Chitinophagales bacterium]